MATSYCIKVPVFVTKTKDSKNKELFGVDNDYTQMVYAVESKVSSYNLQTKYTPFGNKNKTKEFVVKNLSATRHTLAERPCLLVRISAYSTNLLDGYFEGSKKITFDSKDKIGSDNYFMLLFPMITGIESSKYDRYFLVLVYEDPHKDDEELLLIIRYVMRKILGMPIRNIKLSSVLEDLKNARNIPELEIRFTGMSNVEDEVEAKYKDYIVENKLHTTKKTSFRNMPADMLVDMINNTDEVNQYQNQSMKWTIGKKEYKISRQQIDEVKQKIQTTVEKIFNERVSITETELNKIYDPDFVIEKLQVVLQEYLCEELS